MSTLHSPPVHSAVSGRRGIPKKTVSILGSLAVAAGAMSFSLADGVQAFGVGQGSASGHTQSIPVALRAAQSVSIKNVQFNPTDVTMGVGDTVTWTNNEADGTVHNVTADDSSSFVSPDLSPGNTFSFTATRAGDFPYHCKFHPQAIGTVHVTGGGGGAPQQPPPAQPAPPPPPQPAPAPPSDPGPGGGGGLLPGLPDLPSLPDLPVLGGAAPSAADSNPFASFARLLLEAGGR